MQADPDCPLFVEQPPRAPTVPIIAGLPHSGTHVPPAVASGFTPENLAWLRNTDWYLPEIFDFLPDLGIRTLAATLAAM